jgi:glycine/D-amino acid oxidase-like deaminating enzyme
MTSDHVPRIRRLGPGAYGVYGYNGRGIAPGTAFGRCFAELFRSGDEASLPLPIGEEPGGRVAHWRGRLLDAGAAAFHTLSARLGA